MYKSAPTKQLVAYITRSTGYRAYTTRPADATKRTPGVLIQRVGTWKTGEPLPEIDRPVFDLWCCANTVGAVYDMADVVSRAMERFRYEPHISFCKQYAAYDESGPEDGPAFKLVYRITYID